MQAWRVNEIIIYYLSPQHKEKTIIYLHSIKKIGQMSEGNGLSSGYKKKPAKTLYVAMVVSRITCET